MSYWVAKVGTRGRHGGKPSVDRTVLFILPDEVPQPPSRADMMKLAERYVRTDPYQEVLGVSQPQVIEFKLETKQVMVPAEETQ